MPPKRSPKKMPAIANPKTKPVRVDLDPDIHHALRKVAADQNVSMAAFARKLISDEMCRRFGWKSGGPLPGQTSFLPPAKKGSVK